MHNIGFKAVQTWNIRGWGVSKPHIDYVCVYIKAIWSYKKLCDLKCILLALKLYRGGI